MLGIEKAEDDETEAFVATMDQQEASVDEKEQLNAVLDAALDELDDSDSDSDNDDDDEEQHVETAATADSRPSQQQEDTEKPTKPKPVYGPEKPPDFDIGSFDDVMKQMFQGGGDGNDPEAALDSFLQQMQTQLAAEMERMESPHKQESCSTKSDKTAAKQANSTPSTEPPLDGSDVDRTISKLLNDMATANMDEDGGAGDMPGGGEEAMFHDMMKEFEKMGGGAGFDQDAVVDGMMQQLVAKEIMYEPMKQVTDRFPAWLEENKESLSEEEYKR